MRVSELRVAEAQVDIDICKLCHLVWLDPGEMQKIAELKNKHPDVFVPTAENERLRRLAIEAFGSQPKTERPHGVSWPSASQSSAVIQATHQAAVHYGLSAVSPKLGLALMAYDVLSLLMDAFEDE